MPIRIYIDQGHNPSGFNTGAEGNGYFEQDITYEIGVRLFGLLNSDGNFNPRLSRPTPDTVLGTSNTTSLRARVEEANAFGASAFVSLHTNASSDPAANGTECLYYAESARAAKALASDILASLTDATSLRSRGVIARPGLYVLRKTKMPAVIVEMGFITNPRDAALMVSSPDVFAFGIYRGILKFFGVA